MFPNLTLLPHDVILVGVHTCNRTLGFAATLSRHPSSLAPHHFTSTRTTALYQHGASN